MKNENTRNYGVLEFSEIREELKSYLKNQDEFKDYNFEGSNLQVILDLLAYNSHYNNAYRSFAIQENFLASASRRQNIISIADQLGYIPHSASCSKCYVDLILSDFATMPDSVLIDDNVKFLTSVDSENYQFQVSPNNTSYKGVPIYVDAINGITLCDSSEDEKTNGFLLEGIEIIEGTKVQNFYDVKKDEQYKFTIMNPMADLSTLKIQVYPNADILEAANADPNYINTDILKPSLSIYNKTDNFTYYYRESSENTFEVIFKLGYLKKGNVIKMEYYVCNGSKANGAINFRLDNYKGMFAKGEYPNTIVIKSKEASNSGSEKESIDSIRENAPRFYAAQDRAVTEEDYKALLINKFGFIDSISVWGGEKEREIDPGKVIIAVKPINTKYLTETQKNDIISYLGDKKSSSVSIEVRDVNFFDIVLNVNCVYNKNRQTSDLTFGQMYDEINNIISLYCSANLKKFGFIYQESALMKEILSLNYLSSVDIETKIRHDIDTSVKSINVLYEIDFANSIVKGGLTSSTFTQYTTDGSVLSSISDDKEGNVIITNGSTLERRKIGTIDYNEGLISFHDFMTPANKVTLYITPKNNDIINTRNNLLELSSSNDVTISMTEESDKIRFTS